jgi:ERF superfamily
MNTRLPDTAAEYVDELGLRDAPFVSKGPKPDPVKPPPHPEEFMNEDQDPQTSQASQVEEPTYWSLVTSRKEFDEAFAKAQAAFLPIERNREVTVRMRPEKGGGVYTFKYAELHTILKACVPALNAQGISFRQRIAIDQTGKHFVTTILARAGYQIEEDFPINMPQGNHPQDFGGAVTYAKRLGGSMCLGVSAEDDNDGEGPDTLKEPPRERQGKRSGKEEVAQAIEAAAFPKTVSAPAKPEKVYTDKEMADMEGQVVDAVQELLEAASEGRKVGIEQIWAEIRSNEFIATRTWSALKKYPDALATIEEVLRPKARTPRGPKPPAQGNLVP